MRGRDTEGAASPNWYLHPLVAEQKRHVHLELARRWTDGLAVSAALKTDLFEEAFGDDDFYRLSALPTRGWTACFHAVCAEKPKDAIARIV